MCISAWSSGVCSSDLVAMVALGQLGFGEVGAGTLHQLAGEAPAQLVEQAGLAPYPARFEQAGGDGRVVAGEAQAFVDGAGGMADLQSGVPEHVQDVFDHLLAARRDRKSTRLNSSH